MRLQLSLSSYATLGPGQRARGTSKPSPRGMAVGACSKTLASGHLSVSKSRLKMFSKGATARNGASCGVCNADDRYIKSNMLKSLTDEVIDETCDRFTSIPDGCSEYCSRPETMRSRLLTISLAIRIHRRRCPIRRSKLVLSPISPRSKVYSRGAAPVGA